MNAIQKIKLLLLHSSMTLDRALINRGVVYHNKTSSKNDNGWKTAKNGKHYHLNENGKIDKGLGGKFNGKSIKRPKFYPGTTTVKHDEHHKDHARAMGLNKKTWKIKAAEYMNKTNNGEYFDYEINGRYYRYNPKSRELGVGESDGTIRTYFIVDKNKIKYYINWRKYEE